MHSLLFLSVAHREGLKCHSLTGDNSFYHTKTRIAIHTHDYTKRGVFHIFTICFGVLASGATTCELTLENALKTCFAEICCVLSECEREEI